MREYNDLRNTEPQSAKYGIDPKSCVLIGPKRNA